MKGAKVTPMTVAALVFAVLVAIGTAFYISPVFGAMHSGVFEKTREFGRETNELMMLSAAIESYKTDHGHYPTDPATTEQLRANTPYDHFAYMQASAFLYRCLVHDDDNPSSKEKTSGNKRYLTFEPWMVHTNRDGTTYILDVNGQPIGYSTLKSVHPESPDGHNPTFDLWSINGGESQADMGKWVKNW
jgi:hypothetical protein